MNDVVESKNDELRRLVCDIIERSVEIENKISKILGGEREKVSFDYS